MITLQTLRKEFTTYRIHPLDWLGDSPSRFDDYTRYADGCDSILELGVYTGLTTTAFLLAKPKILISIDIDESAFSLKSCLEDLALRQNTVFKFHKMNDMDYESSGHDLLFIDTSHTYEHTLAELTRFGPQTKKRIVLHDVASFPGVYQAMMEWLWTQKNTFHVMEHDSRGDGVVVLQRYPGSI